MAGAPPAGYRHLTPSPRPEHDHLLRERRQPVFDTVLGLPVHVLVVHGVVVLLPLMALVTLAWAFWQDAPRLAGLAVVVANAGVAALTFVAKESGEALQERLGGQIAQEHAEIADVLPFFALSLLFASVLVQALRSRDIRVPGRLPGVLTAVVALVAIGWTVRAGHSGSESVWGEVVRQTGR
jgi:hypothetical protein